MILFFVPGAVSAQNNVDLILNVDYTPNPVNAPGVVAYTVQATNNKDVSDVDATGVEVSIDVPAGMLYNGFQDLAGINCTGLAIGQDNGIVTCTLPDIPLAAGSDPDEFVEFDIYLQSTQADAYEIDFSLQGDQPDPEPANNTESIISVVNQGADLSLDITTAGGVTMVESGSVVGYNFTVTNHGPNDASGTSVSYEIPAGHIVSDLPPGCSSNGTHITCNIPGTINAGDDVTIGPVEMQVTVAGGSDISNVAEVIAGSPPDPLPDNNIDIFVLDVLFGSDINIAKSRSAGGPYFVGDMFDFILDPTYTGDIPTGLTIEDHIPSEYTILTGDFTQNGWDCAVTGQLVECTKQEGGTEAGASQSMGIVEIPVEINQAGTDIMNTATLRAENPATTVSGNDGGVVLQDPLTDFSITKTGPSPALVVQGQPFNYTITARNNGPEVFFGTLRIVENLPAGLTIEGYTLNGWTCYLESDPGDTNPTPVTGPETLFCDRDYPEDPPLAANTNAPSLGLEVVADTEGVINNTVEVTSPNPNVDFDGDTDSSPVTSSEPPEAADISIIKTVVGPDPVPAGEVLTYRLQLVNEGPETSEDVVVTDDLTSLINNQVGPEHGFVGFSIIEPGTAGLDSGDCSTASSGGTSRLFTCNIDTFPVCDEDNDCPIIEIDVRPNRATTGNRTNTANIVSNTTADPSSGNNEDSATSVVEARADIAVEKTATPIPVPVGQQLVYSIAVTNNGPSSAQDVQIVDELPLDVVFIGVSDLGGGGTCSLTPTPDVPTTPGNRTIECSWPNIENGAQRTATITVRPNYPLYLTGTPPDPITNEVTVSTSTIEPSDAPANNTDDVTVDLDPPSLNLTVSKSDGTDPVTINDENVNERQTVYTITVNNGGPSDASEVVIIDDMPAGLSYQAHDITHGSCSTVPSEGEVEGRLICEVDRVFAGEQVILEITAEAVTKGVYTNHVFVRSDETHDGPIDYDNPLDPSQETGFNQSYGAMSSSETTTVRTRVDLEMESKIASPDPVAVGADFEWTARLVNRVGPGLAEADDVVISDTFPAGSNMELTGTPTVSVTSGTVEFTTCTGTAGDTSFTCELGEVSNGAEVNIIIPVLVTEIDAVSVVIPNTISVSTSSRDIDPSNNGITGNVTVEGGSIEGIVYRDFDDDGLFNNNDTGISGISMTLNGTAFNGLSVNKSATTNGDGEYIFTGLPESDGIGYTITRGTVSEPYLEVGQQTATHPGTEVGTIGEMSAINLGEFQNLEDFLFGYIPRPRVGLAKRVLDTPEINDDASFDVDFRIRVENYSLEPISGIEIDDLLAGTPPLFGTFVAGGSGASLTPNQYTIQTAPSFNGTCETGTVNSSFNGDSNQRLAEIGNLPIDGSCEIDFTLRFEPSVPLPVPLPDPSYQNQADVQGEGAWTGDDVDDLSQDGANPDPDSDGDPTNNNDPTPVVVTPIADVTTSVDFPLDVDAGETVNGTIDFENDGPSTAENVTYELVLSPNLTDVVIDNLPGGAGFSYNPANGVVTFTGMPEILEAGETIPGITVSYTQNGEANSTVTSTIGTSTSQGANVLPDSDSATIPGDLIADVTTSVNFPPDVDAGQIVSGIILFENLGPSTASDVTYSVQLEPGLELLGPVTFGNLPGGASAVYDDGTGLVTFTGMPSSLAMDQIASGNGSTGIEINYVQPGTAYSEIVSNIGTSTTQPPGHAPDSDSAEVNGDFIADVTTSLIGFPLVDVDAGEPVTGNVIFTNVGPSDAEDVTYELILDPDLTLLGPVVIDNLPPGASAVYDADTGIVTFSDMPSTLAPDEIASGDGTNGITVSYTQPGAAISTVHSIIGTSTQQPDPHQPDQAQVSPGGGFIADVTTVVSFPSDVDAGETVSGTVLYRNNGPSDAEDVTYILTLTPELADVTFGNLPAGATADYDPATGEVTFTGMPETLGHMEIASEDGTTGITVSYTQNGIADSDVNSEIGTSTDQGLNLAQDDDAANITGELIADVTTELDFPPVVDALTTVNGTVIYRNAGPSTASDMEYTLTLLPDLEDVEFGNLPAGASADYDPDTGIVTLTDMPTELLIDEIASGDGTTGITISYTQPAAGESEVESTIGTSTNQGDNVLQDEDEVYIEGKVADVTTEVTISSSADAGQPVTGTVLYQNNGPSEGEDITYELVFEPGLEDVEFGNLPVGASADYDPDTGIVTLTDMPSELASGEIASGDGAEPITFGYTQPGPAHSEVRSTIGTSTNQGANLAQDDDEVSVSGGLVSDLAVTKTTDADIVVPNTNVEYTIRVENHGPSDVPAGSMLKDTPEGLELISASCTSASGNTCTSALNANQLGSSSGASLPAIAMGGFYETIVTARVTAFDGTVENSIEVDPPSGVTDPVPENNDDFVTNPVEGHPSIGLAKAASELESMTGGGFRTDFVITVKNFGSEGLKDVVVTDPLSTGAGGTFGVHSAAGGLQPGEYRVRNINASGLTANSGFNGDSDTVLATGTMEVDATATVTFVLEFVPQPYSEPLTNQAKGTGTGTETDRPTEDVSQDGHDPDPDGDGTPSNNTDPTPVLVPAVGVAKMVSEMENLQDGRYDVTFSVHVENLGATPLQMVQIEDDLENFGVYTDEEFPGAGEYTVISDPVISSSQNGAALTARPAGEFTGSGSGIGLLVPESSTLPQGLPDASLSRIDFTIRFFPAGEGPFLNTALASGISPDGSEVFDQSVDGSEPDPTTGIPTEVPVEGQVIGLAKAAEEMVQTGIRSFIVPFRLLVRNMSETATATNVQVTDNLTEAFPTAETIEISTPPEIFACTGTVLNPSDSPFDGIDQVNFLAGDQHLQPGEECAIRFSVEVNFGINPLPDETQYNLAHTTTSGIPDGPVIAEAFSHDGDTPVGNGPGEPTPVIFVPLDPGMEEELLVTKSSPVVNVSVGQLVPFTITITNPHSVPIYNAEIRDIAPPGFRYISESAVVDGIVLEPEMEGRTLFWRDLLFEPGQTRTIRLVMVVGAGVQIGEYTNFAQAFDGTRQPPDERPISVQASASVRVVPDPVFECSDIVGKVFHDANGNGVQDPGEMGLPNVRVITARGWHVTTDHDGQYHIACAAWPDPERGSNFVVKLDEASLDGGYNVATENPRTVRVTAGKVTEVNFGVTTPRTIRVVMRDEAFLPGSAELEAEWLSRLEDLQNESRSGSRKVLLQIVYRGETGDDPRLARARTQAAADFIQNRWREESLRNVVRVDEFVEMVPLNEIRR